MSGGKFYYQMLTEDMSYQDIALANNTTYEAVRSAVQRFYTKHNLPSPSEFYTLVLVHKAHLVKKVSDLVFGKVSDVISADTQDFIKQVKTNADGTKEIQNVIDGTKDQLDDPDYVLKATGFDPTKWTVKEYTVSQWGSDESPRHSVRLKIAPRSSSGLDIKALVQSLKYDITSLSYVEHVHELVAKKHLLVVPLFDLHYQDNDDRSIQRMFKDINKIIQDNTYQHILILFGGDGLEHDNFMYTTESGTRTEDTDIRADYQALYAQLESLTKIASEHAEAVTFQYLRGNHSPSLDWALTNKLAARFENYPNVFVDEDADVLVKSFSTGNIFIGSFHGQQKIAEKNLAPSLIEKFPVAWSKANFRMIHSGHYHTSSEQIILAEKDLVSAMYHPQPSPKKANEWAVNKDYGSHFVGLKIYEYSKFGISNVHYL